MLYACAPRFYDEECEKIYKIFWKRAATSQRNPTPQHVTKDGTYECSVAFPGVAHHLGRAGITSPRRNHHSPPDLEPSITCLFFHGMVIRYIRINAS